LITTTPTGVLRDPFDRSTRKFHRRTDLQAPGAYGIRSDTRDGDLPLHGHPDRYRGFRYANTGKETLLAAAGLIAAGANPQWIAENVYETYPLAKIRLLSSVLPTLTIDEGGRVGSLTITQRALETAGASHDHAEGFVDFPRSIRGVKISILYAELPDGRFKLSLRSKGNVNVAQIAGVFGGGGHINAAACRMEGKIDAIHRRMLEAIRTSGEL